MRMPPRTVGSTTELMCTGWSSFAEYTSVSRLIWSMFSGDAVVTVIIDSPMWRENLLISHWMVSR